MAKQSVEMCSVCDQPTGYAGIAEDSLYCEYCGEGPFCDTCYDTHMLTCATGPSENID
jgi:hypothetical protein